MKIYHQKPTKSIVGFFEIVQVFLLILRETIQTWRTKKQCHDFSLVSKFIYHPYCFFFVSNLLLMRVFFSNKFLMCFILVGLFRRLSLQNLITSESQRRKFRFFPTIHRRATFSEPLLVHDYQNPPQYITTSSTSNSRSKIFTKSKSVCSKYQS